MAKTKTPFLSLASRGTVGQVLTSQKRGSSTLLREKPLPAYRRTLPQQYQRWLYEDYAYLWTKQTEATRRQYATKGSRWHLTGFQYWMKEHLLTLPDIVGWWTLDEKTGAIARDRSKNANHGTIYGASPVVGRIDHARYFDGINDYIDCSNNPTLYQNTAFTIELYGKVITTGTPIAKCNASGATADGWFSRFYSPSRLFRFYFYQADHAQKSADSPNITGDFHHAAGVYNGSDTIQAFVNGQPGTPVAVVGFSPDTIYPLIIGRLNYTTAYWIESTLDHIIFTSRALDDTEILRHSERRYPS